MKDIPLFCPSTLAMGYDSYSPAALKRLFKGQKASAILPYNFPAQGTEEETLFANNHKYVALAGTQRKYTLVLKDGILKLSTDKRKGHYLLKPIFSGIKNEGERAANEHLTMQIAEQVFKIETAANGLCFFRTGEIAYLARRFDIVGNDNKYRIEDFASLAGVTGDNAGANFKYDQCSYEEMAALIKKYIPAWRIELLKFFRIILFNFLFSNGDAHLKKFSVVETIDGDFSLAPAYSLLNTRLHGNEVEFALDKGLFEKKDRKLLKGGAWVNGATLRAFGIKIGLPEKMVDRELKLFTASHPHVQQLLHNSFLCETLKPIYLSQYLERKERLRDMER
ncbi:HipA domain-containing protein [Bacteroidales bacterium OttesenSCG-928-J16]|nr:HipA domain-containing protein [Bacteroidales bacterium OttesenSCG-928-J16]